MQYAQGGIWGMKAEDVMNVLQKWTGVQGEEAIDAAENSDFSKIETILEIVTNPYDELEKYQNYAEKSPEWAKNLEISCSS